MHDDPGDSALNGCVAAIDWDRCHWLFKRTMRLWEGGKGLEWNLAARQAAAEFAMARWLGYVFRASPC